MKTSMFDRSRLVLLFALIAAPSAFSACSDAQDLRCLVGATVPCTCTTGALGAQTCLADGKSLSPCVCARDEDTTLGPDLHSDTAEDTTDTTPEVSDPPDGDSVDHDSDEDVQPSDIPSPPGDTLPETDTSEADGLERDAAEVSSPDTTCEGCPCSRATIVIDEGLEVIPLTRLHLSASHDAGANRALSFSWTVEEPQGSRSLFHPSAYVENPTFEVTLAGTYVFRVTIQDGAGSITCPSAEATVVVTPDSDLHIALFWDTPGDRDPYDTGPYAGSDLDLHFAHPLANGGYDGDHDGENDGWYDMPFDVFWFNSQPNWGSIQPTVDDNPGLDRDDTDGAGPELLNFNHPEDGLTYRVGVHYWNDRDLGPSVATLRVYLYGTLAFESPAVALEHHDMWEVTHVTWPPSSAAPPALVQVCAGTTTACTSDAECDGATCGPRVAPDYEHPFYPSDD